MGLCRHGLALPGYLPHFDHPGLVQSLVFRLHDSVPRAVIEGWRTELGWREGLAASDPLVVELRRRLDQYEDRGAGDCWLGRSEIAAVVEGALLHFDGTRYRLLGWCVMPNHVHVVFEQLEVFAVPVVVQAWKSFTAKAANRLLRRAGKFWAPEYYDRVVRDRFHLLRVLEYVENNPVKAGLVAVREAWEWSSAGRRHREELRRCR